MTASSEQRLLDDLRDHDVAFAVHEHSPVATVAESGDLHHHIPGAHTKNLFLKDERGRFWLVTMPHDRRADLKFVQAQIGAARLSFGKPEPMRELLGVAPGSVTPLAAINDVECRVTVVLDAAFGGPGPINVHPLRNTATLSLDIADLIASLVRWNHAPLIAELTPSG